MPASAETPAAACEESSDMVRRSCSRESWDGAVRRPWASRPSSSSRSPWRWSSGSCPISCSAPVSTPRSVAVRAQNPSGSSSRSIRGTIVSHSTRSVSRWASVRSCGIAGSSSCWATLAGRLPRRSSSESRSGDRAEARVPTRGPSVRSVTHFRGTTREHFAPVARAFARLLGRGSGGGAVVVRLRGQTVVDLSVGSADAVGSRPWTPETLGLSFSTTKGVASTVIHRLADRGALDYDEPVASYWPEFAAGGKQDVTVRDVLTHHAGLSSVQAVASRAEDLLDHIGMEERLAARTTRAPTSRSAYHAITYGWLVAGIARRVTGGQGLADLVKSEIAEPLGAPALHIGVRDTARELVAEPVGGGLRQIG